MHEFAQQHGDVVSVTPLHACTPCINNANCVGWGVKLYALTSFRYGRRSEAVELCSATSDVNAVAGGGVYKWWR